MTEDGSPAAHFEHTVAITRGRAVGAHGRRWRQEGFARLAQQPPRELAPSQQLRRMPMASDPRIRASDADRDRTAALLREHHAAGRLTAEEFNERLDKAYAAEDPGRSG